VTLVDTSVWVEHFRLGNPELAAKLLAGEVATHAMVVGELACGRLPDRRRTLALLQHLPAVPRLDDGLVLEVVERRGWRGQGVGWVDVHLAAAALAAAMPLWTLDRRLARLVGEG